MESPASPDMMPSSQVFDDNDMLLTLADEDTISVAPPASQAAEQTGERTKEEENPPKVEAGLQFSAHPHVAQGMHFLEPPTNFQMLMLQNQVDALEHRMANAEQRNSLLTLLLQEVNRHMMVRQRQEEATSQR